MEYLIRKRIEEHINLAELMLKSNVLEEVDLISTKIKNALSNGNKIFFCGNGGSAADSQHLAAEFVGRFQKERKGLPAIALTVDTSILTAVGNDYGYENVFSRQVEALAKPGDVLVGISTSGNSENVVKAIMLAKSMGVYTVGMTAIGGGKMAEICDQCIAVPAKVTARAQEMHILIGHILCELIDK